MFSFAKKIVDRFDVKTSSDSEFDSHFKDALSLNNKGYGLRVLSIEPHSTAHAKGVEAWFDYIVRVNGHELPMLNPAMSQYSYSINDDGSINYGGYTTHDQVGEINYQLLQRELSSSVQNENGSHEVIFDVWNAKGGVMRQITFELSSPTEFDESNESDQTNGFDLFKNTFKKLGMAVQSQHLSTSTYVWRILATHPGSPAFQAQLVPYSDYIIGCDSAFSEEHKGLLSAGGESLLSRTVQNYYNHHSITHGDSVPITLYVYNHDYDVLRPVTINLSKGWGNGQQRGILGCDVGYGLLHRIPEVIGKFGNSGLTDDLLFENNQNYDFQLPQTTTVLSPSSPATFNAASPVAPPPPPMGLSHAPRSTAPKKKKNNAAVLGELSDYMNEQLIKSKEMDHLSTPTSAASSPPPPPPPSSNSKTTTS